MENNSAMEKSSSRVKKIRLVFYLFDLNNSQTGTFMRQALDRY